jgi:hypothetical protein
VVDIVAGVLAEVGRLESPPLRMGLVGGGGALGDMGDRTARGHR